MKIQQSKNRYVNLKNGLIAVVVLIVIGAGVLYALTSRSPSQDMGADGPTPEQQKEMQKVDNDKKKSF